MESFLPTPKEKNIHALRRESRNVHSLGSLDIKLAGAQEPQEGQRIQTLSVSELFKLSAELVHLCILFGGGVAGVARLRFRSGGREVVLVVLGVGRQLGFCGRHCDGWEVYGRGGRGELLFWKKGGRRRRGTTGVSGHFKMKKKGLRDLWGSSNVISYC